ncbi:MAG: efflux RND transporter periplasmic adaptor subunit, partial [Pirellulales bacterium]
TQGRAGYIIEDVVNSKFFRLGMAEYHFVSLLNGKRTVRDALAMTATARPDDSLTEHDVAMLCQWLVDTDLAHTDSSSAADRLHAASTKAAKRQFMSRINPIFIRIPLLRPEGLLNRLAPWLGWLFSPLALVAWLILVTWAAGVLAINGDRFADSISGIFSPNGYILLIASWVILKVLHELGHGLACKRFGGYVREAGVVLLLFLPIAYIDTSSSWRFRSRLQRIITAAAGMYVELGLAAVAMLAWNATGDGLLNQFFANLVLMASITTLLFNANPLMRFDGYYMLSDALDVPNLYGSGQQYLQYAGRKWLMGLNGTLPPWPQRAARMIKIYGFASFAWRIFICTAMLVAAATLFHGAGIVIAVLGIISWVGVPAYRFARFAFTGKNLRWSQRGRLVLTSSAIVSVVVVVFCVCPWPFAHRAPGYVEYSPVTVVRADSAGFLRTIHVRNGQRVEQGDVLAVLQNDDLELELAGLDLRIEQSRLKRIAHQTRHEMAAYQAEQKEVESLKKQKAEIKAQVHQLTMRAPAAGTVLRRRLDGLAGIYLKQGDEILSIGNNSQKEIRLSVAQQDVEFFRSALDATVQVRIAGGTKIQATLTELEPRASQEPPHLSLCATNGGSLAVQQSAPPTDDEQSAGPSYQLVEPRFSGTVPLNAGQSERIFSGQRAVVRLTGQTESIGRHLYRSFQDWLKIRFDAARRG